MMIRPEVTSSFAFNNSHPLGGCFRAVAVAFAVSWLAAHRLMAVCGHGWVFTARWVARWVCAGHAATPPWRALSSR